MTDNLQQKTLSSERHHELTNLVIKEINGCWFLVNSEKLIPNAQINYLSDIQNCSKFDIIKAFETGHYAERRWRSISYYLHSFYKTDEEQLLSYQWLQSFCNQSEIAQYIITVHNNEMDKIKFMVEEDNVAIAMVLQAIDLFSHEDVQAVYSLALKLIRQLGIHLQSQGGGIQIIPKITGLGLICAIFDCYPKERSNILAQASKDLYFQASLFQQLLESYSTNNINNILSNQQQSNNSRIMVSKQIQQNKNKQLQILQQPRQVDNQDLSQDIQQQQQSQILLNSMEIDNEKDKRIDIIKNLIDKFLEMSIKNVRQAEFLLVEFSKLYQIMAFGEVQESKLEEEHPDLINHNNLYLWQSIKQRILNRSVLTKTELEEWRRLAFSQFYRDALIMLGEKSLIIDKDVTRAMMCYSILFSTGEPASAGILYNLLCFQKQFQEAQIVAQRMGSFLKVSGCLIKMGQTREAHELIRQQYFTHKDFSSELFASYNLIKCVILSEEKKFLGALAIFDIIRRDKGAYTNINSQADSVCGNNIASPLLKLYILAKLLEKSNYLQYDSQKMLQVLKFAKSTFKPKLMYEYICLMYIKRKISQIKKTHQMGEKSIKDLEKQGKVKKSSKKGFLAKNKQKISNQKNLLKQNYPYYQQPQNLSQQSNHRNLQQKAGSSPLRQTKHNYYEQYSIFNEQQEDEDEYIDSKDKLNDNTDKQDQKSTKSSKINKWQNKVEIIIGTNVSEVRRYIEEELEQLHKQTKNSDNQFRTQKMIEHTQFLYQLGMSIIYPQVQFYDTKNNSFYQIDIKKINKATTFSYSQFRNQISTWFFDLISRKPKSNRGGQYIQTQEHDEQDNLELDISKQQGLQQNEKSRIDQEVQQSDAMGGMEKVKFLNKLISQMKVKPQAKLQGSNLFNFSFNQKNNMIDFSGALIEQYPPHFRQEDLVFQNNGKGDCNNINDGYFSFNNQKFSFFTINIDNQTDEEIIKNINKSIFPFALNIYGLHASQNKQEGSSITVISEPIVMPFLEFKSQSQPAISDLSIVIELLTICTALHLGCQGGLLSLYGCNLLVWDQEYHIKTINILQYLFGQIKFDESCHSPEVYLDDSQREIQDVASKSDIWALGALMYRIFYGQTLVDSKENIIDQYLQFRQKTKIAQMLAKEPMKDSIFPLTSSKEHIKNFIQDLIAKCIMFDPYSRPSAIELLLYLHDFLKNKIKSNNNKGIFTFFSYSTLIKRINSLQRVIIQGGDQPQQQLTKTEIEDNNKEQKIAEEYQTLDKANNTKQNPSEKKNLNTNSFIDDSIKPTSSQTNIKKPRPQSTLYSRNSMTSAQQNTEGKDGVDEAKELKVYILSGGSVLVYLGQGFIFYFGTERQKYVLCNPYLESKEQVNTFTLPEILQGEGYEIFEDGRILLGNFGENGILQSCILKSPFSQTLKWQNCHKSNSQKNLGIVSSINLQSKAVNQYKQVLLSFDETTRLPEDLTITCFSLDNYSREIQAEDDRMITQFVNKLKKVLTNNLFPDIFGNWLHCDFNDNSQPNIGPEREPLVLVDNSKILLIQGKTAEVLDLATLSFSQWNNQKIADSQYSNICAFCQYIEKMQTCENIKQFFLEGVKFSGMMNQWLQEGGILQFQFGSRMQICGAALPGEPYLTRIDYINGDFYEGLISDGQYNGQGVYGNKNNKILEGLFKNDKFLQGRIYYYDDMHDIYEGEVIYVAGQEQDQEQKEGFYHRHGKGVLYFRNRDVYEGDFSYGLYHGFGILKYKDGKKGIYQGQFKNGHREGEGTLRDEQGNHYEGQFLKGKKHFKGREIYRNGNIYEGEFQNGKREGLGLLSFQEGNILSFSGEFKDDQRNGEGVEIYKDGKKFRVKYYKDQMIRKMQIGVIKVDQAQVANEENKFQDDHFQGESSLMQQQSQSIQNQGNFKEYSFF